MSVLDFDRRQYRLLLGLMRDLGARRELTSQLGLDASAMYLMGPFLLLIGGVCSLFALAHPPPRGFLMLLLGLTAFFLVPTLVSEAADAFMNPAEASVLAHRPVRGSTYAAAKLTYVFRASLMVTLPLNAIPAFAGLALSGTRWFYPLTHLAAAALMGCCIALLACGAFGVLFGIVPIRRLRSAAMWAQLVAAVAVPLAPQLLRFPGRGPGSLDLDAAYWSAVPITWFASLGLIGQATRPLIVWTYALPSALGCVILIAVGVTALSQTYMTRVVMVMRARQAHAGAGRIRIRRTLTHWIPGRPATRGTAAFVVKMAMREWQFRRSFLQANMFLVVILGLSLVRGGFLSPLGARRLVPIQLTPHLFGILAVMTSQFLSFSDRYRAGWIFQTTPGSAFRSMARGVFWAMWSIFAALPALMLLVAGVWAWGARDGVIFAAYELAVTSTYLGVALWLADGIPFTKPPRPSRAAASQSAVLVLMLTAVVAAGIQASLILPNRVTTVAATLALSLLAPAVTWASLRVLEVRMKTSVDLVGASPTRMFAASAED